MEILGLFEIPNRFVVFGSLLVAAYTYLTWTYNTWRKLGIPGPKPAILFGTIHGIFKMGLFESDRENIKKYGKVVGHYVGRTPTLLIADLDILKQILIKDSHLFINRKSLRGFDEYPIRKMLTVLRDEHWKNVRVILTPNFSGKKIRRMIEHMNRCSENLVKHFSEKAVKNESFETKEYMGAFTMDVIAATGFGLELNSLSDRNNLFIQNARKIFDINPLRPSILLSLLFPFLAPYLNKVGLHLLPKDAIDFFCDIVDQTIEARAEQNVNETDFLQLMLNARHDTEAGNDAGDHSDGTVEKCDENPKRGLTKEELVAQAMFFLVAGYETVNAAMGLLAYNLATNPECQEKLQQEIDRVMEGQDIPTYELISQMSYLDMCIDESLRIYPPALRTDRQCTAERDVVINGVTIPKDTIVAIPVMAIHYDSEYWPEPDKFDPERFTPEAKSRRPQMAWLPFGEGPRHCIGMRLALAEIKVAMVHILRKFSFVTCEETLIPMKLEKIRMKAIKPGIILKLKERQADNQ